MEEGIRLLSLANRGALLTVHRWAWNARQAGHRFHPQSECSLLRSPFGHHPPVVPPGTLNLNKTQFPKRNVSSSISKPRRRENPFDSPPVKAAYFNLVWLSVRLPYLPPGQSPLVEVDVAQGRN